jgi:hypothetical protein
MGYSTFMLSDGLCFREESAMNAISSMGALFKAWRKR